MTQLKQTHEVTNSSFARHVGVDHSYITLFRRDGYIPTEKVMNMLEDGFRFFEIPEIDITELWLSAGYLPPCVPSRLIPKYAKAMTKEKEAIKEDIQDQD
jgi:hypothetical protein